MPSVLEERLGAFLGTELAVALTSLDGEDAGLSPNVLMVLLAGFGGSDVGGHRHTDVVD